MKILYLNKNNGIVLFIVLLTLSYLWIDARNHFFIPCVSNCGETFVSLQYAENFKLYGTKYGFIEDLATSASLADRPFLYTHNVNIGGILFGLLQASGIDSIWFKQFFTLIIFGIGLVYCYLATSSILDSRRAGIYALLFLVLDLPHVLSFSLNPLRVWHFFVFFGTLFHVGKIIFYTKSTIHWCLLSIVLFCAFGIGYDFWIICALISYVFFIFGYLNGLGKSKFLNNILILTFALLLPFTIRQLQIIFFLGFDFWINDFFITAVIKISLLNQFLQIPSMVDIDAYYSSMNVLRPPATPPKNLIEVFNTIFQFLKEIAVPSFGLISLCLVLFWWLYSIKRNLFIFGSSKVPLWDFNTRVSILGISTCLGVTFGTFIFSPISYHIYLKHEFPLIIMIVVIFKSITLELTTRYILSYSNNPSKPKTKLFILYFIFFIILLDFSIVLIRNINNKKTSMDTSWIPHVLFNKNSDFAVSWIPNTISGLTGRYTLGVLPGREWVFLDRLSSCDKNLFRDEDRFLFGERNFEKDKDKYLSADYWLYFPTDQNNPFDQPIRSCQLDYLVAYFYKLAYRLKAQIYPTFENSLILQREVIGRGDKFRIQGNLSIPWHQLDSVSFELKRLNSSSTDNINAQNESNTSTFNIFSNGKALLNQSFNINFNCVYNVLIVDINDTTGFAAGKYQVIMTTSDINNRLSKTTHYFYINSNNASSFSTDNIINNQPKISEILSRYPHLPKLTFNDSHIIFDLNNQKLICEANTDK